MTAATCRTVAKLRAMRAAHAAKASDFPALARAFLREFENEAKNANERLQVVEALLDELRYNEANELLTKEPPLLELCNGLRHIEADKHGVLSACRVVIKRGVDTKRLARVKLALSNRETEKLPSVPPPLPASVGGSSASNARATLHRESSQSHVLFVSIAFCCFGALFFVVSLLIIFLRPANPTQIASSNFLSTPEFRYEELQNTVIPPVIETLTAEKIRPLIKDTESQLAAADDRTQNANPTTFKAGDSTPEVANRKPQDSDNVYPPKVDSSHEEELAKHETIAGEIDAKRLLLGEISVKVRIPIAKGFTFKDVRYANTPDGAAQSFTSVIISSSTPQIKVIKANVDPFVIDAVLDPKEDELADLATSIKSKWNELGAKLAGWQNWFKSNARDQVVEMKLARPAEPEPNESLTEFIERLDAFDQDVSEIRKRVGEKKRIYAERTTKALAEQNFQILEDRLKQIVELIKRLRSDLDAVCNTRREFETGTIMYIGSIDKVLNGKLVDPIALNARFVIGSGN